jgi:hypothetical protein
MGGQQVGPEPVAEGGTGTAGGEYVVYPLRGRAQLVV